MIKQFLLRTTSLFVFAGMVICSSSHAVAYDPNRQRHMQPSVEINLDVLKDIAEKPVYDRPEPAAPAARAVPQATPQSAFPPVPGKVQPPKHKKKLPHRQKRVDTAPEVEVVANKEAENLAPAPMQLPPKPKPVQKLPGKPMPVQKPMPVPVIESLPATLPSMPAKPVASTKPQSSKKVAPVAPIEALPSDFTDIAKLPSAPVMPPLPAARPTSLPAPQMPSAPMPPSLPALPEPEAMPPAHKPAPEIEQLPPSAQAPSLPPMPPSLPTLPEPEAMPPAHKPAPEIEQLAAATSPGVFAASYAADASWAFR